MLTYLAIGIVIGVVTCVPIGVANVAVIDAVYRHNLARGVAVGLGGALADGVYSSLGVFGLGPLLNRNPAVPPILYAVSGLVLVVYGILVMRSRPVLASPADPAHEAGRKHLGAGVALGLAVTLLNPSAVVTWVVILGSYTLGVGAHDGIACVVGVVVGSLVWFIVVAYLADHGKRVLSDNAIWMTRIVGLIVAAYGLFSLGRAIRYFAA